MELIHLSHDLFLLYKKLHYFHTFYPELMIFMGEKIIPMIKLPAQNYDLND